MVGEDDANVCHSWCDSQSCSGATTSRSSGSAEPVIKGPAHLCARYAGHLDEHVYFLCYTSVGRQRHRPEGTDRRTSVVNYIQTSDPEGAAATSSGHRGADESIVVVGSYTAASSGGLVADLLARFVEKKSKSNNRSIDS